jgi:hypothetical protein
MRRMSEDAGWQIIKAPDEGIGDTKRKAKKGKDEDEADAKRARA